MKLELWYIVSMDMLTNTPEYMAGPFASWSDAMTHREQSTGCFAPHVEIVKTLVDID